MRQLELDRVSKHYGAVRAVEGVSFGVERGETVAILGPSGSGKSTLARLITRLEEPTSGRILLDGEDVSRAGPAELRALRKKIGLVFQDPSSALDPRMSIGESVAEPLEIDGVTPQAARAKVRELLGSVGLSPERAELHPHQLSGGQLRRVALARALALEPELLILDEPGAGLDPSVHAQVLNLLIDVRARARASLIVITHDLRSIERFADRVLRMESGRLSG